MSIASNDSLFAPLTVGALELPNRVLMAPLTRNRAQSDGTPNASAETYYRQRASAGLIVTEATQISAMGKGYLDTPGIYEQSHVDAWKQVIRGVHAAGGRIVCQLWHVGRISHTSLLPEGRNPLAPSAIQADGQTYTSNGFEACSKPEAMEITDIKETVDDYAHAARCALEAGFDGVEIHAANGYLIDQFLQDKTNQRTDEYGGSIENRLRFLKAVIDAVRGVWDADRIGIRLSPLGHANDIADSDTEALFTQVYDYLNSQQLAYLHVVEQFPGNQNDSAQQQLLNTLKNRYQGTYIGNGGYDADMAVRAINEGRVDAVTFGRPFIANPDLPERFRLGASLNEPDSDTFYGGDETGYTDYPFLDRH